MSKPLEDYALIGDCQTSALVARDGSIDWLCLPRFDSSACFAALLGTEDHGFWRIAPCGQATRVKRRYRGDTLVLETEISTAEGTVALVDFMPLRSQTADLVRIVEGRRGRVAMEMALQIRFDYGSIVPWVRRTEGGIVAIGGPDMVRLRTTAPLSGEGLRTVSRFTVGEGERVSFDLTWFPSHEAAPPPIDPAAALVETEDFWRRWSARSRYQGSWSEPVARSLVTLKALTYAPTGGIVAAPTTSLPEHLGGVRNWDYRYCWLRDATFTLQALAGAGYLDEARAWREWLLRAAAGTPSQLHIMYGVAGERRLPELELPWLPGYEASRPVRTGNGAHTQLQLDVFGELLDAMHQCWRVGLAPEPGAWRLERAVVEFLETIWGEPDQGIWEVRGPRRHFTHSKLMAWVALDRAVKGIEQYGLDGPLPRWREVRDRIHAEVCEKGFNQRRGAFVQYYGSDLLDASLLMMPLVGFLPAADPRVRGTVEAIERDLTRDGFVARYSTLPEVDGLPPGEGAFLLCTFWLADALILLGRREDARRIFEGVLSARNDVGLLSESFDVGSRRLVGNFPQAFSHIGLINTAINLSEPHGPAEVRASEQSLGSERKSDLEL
ncbi:MAG TPA: glycoside hydrolase family 15 protein [Candidatus Limnocylindrales bacterium]|nr:glycoside hydrolase family 15 protein [Candidatus Limnocylindrales bacterium]